MLVGISTSVTVDRNRSRGGRSSIQTRTCALGSVRTKVKTTLESIITIALPHSKRGGSRISSRGSNFSSTSLKGLNTSWIAVPNSSTGAYS